MIKKFHGLYLITFEQFLLINVARSKLSNIIEEYDTTTLVEHNKQISSPKISAKDEEEPVDSVYQRCVTKVISLEYSKLQRQYLSQLKEGHDSSKRQAKMMEGYDRNDYGILTGTKEELDLLILEAKTRVLNWFGDPTVLIKLNENNYVVADIDADTIALKIMSPSQGALVLYCPLKHCYISLANDVMLNEPEILIGLDEIN